MLDVSLTYHIHAKDVGELEASVATRHQIDNSFAEQRHQITMTSKETFLRQKDICDPLRAIVHESWFEKCLIYAIASMAESTGSTSEELRGANKFRDILLNLPEEEEAPTAFAITGLDHNINDPKKPSDQPAKKE